jgi:hypothetical protein
VPERSDASPQVIYQISEREAFITILDIYAIELPSQSVDDVVKGHYRGYNATARFAMDWTDHQVLVIPAKGTDKDGRAVRGYWYDIHSSGSRIFENPLRHNRIRQMIHETLQKTAIGVTNLQDGEYETDGKEYLGLKRDARDIKLGIRPPGTPNVDRPAGPSNVDRLNELKTMRDKGLITEEEYQAKRRQILDRM